MAQPDLYLEPMHQTVRILCKERVLPRILTDVGKRFLVNDQRDAQFFSMYLFSTLYMFRAHRAHHQDREIVSIQPLVACHSCVGGRVVCRSEVHFRPARDTYVCTYMHKHHFGNTFRTLLYGYRHKLGIFCPRCNYVY
jgi:hypothetical protein